jgi:hypothetical protein
MVRPIPAMITMASIKLMPGISASRCAAASTCESGLVPRPGPVAPVASTPQDSVTWASAAMAWSPIAVIRWSKNATWSSSICAITPWWEPDMPSSASASSSRLPRSGPLAGPAIVRGSRSPAISAATIATADLALIPSFTTEVILTMASSSSFSRRCRQRSAPGPGRSGPG